MAIFEYLVKSAGMTKQALSPQLLMRAVQALEKAGPERIINKVTGRLKVPVNAKGELGYAPAVGRGGNVSKNNYGGSRNSAHADSNLPRLEFLRRMTTAMQSGARNWRNIANSKPFSLSSAYASNPFVPQGSVAYYLSPSPFYGSSPIMASRSAANYAKELLSGYKPDVSNSMSKILMDKTLTPEARKFVAAHYNFVPKMKVGMPDGPYDRGLPKLPDGEFKWRE